MARRYHQQATAGDNATERPMWAEKGGLDFEGRARWDAWTNFKASGGRCSSLPASRSLGGQPRRAHPLKKTLPAAAAAALQGVATEKAKLEFVRTYYEFPAKALYTDTRP